MCLLEWKKAKDTRTAITLQHIYTNKATNLLTEWTEITSFFLHLSVMLKSYFYLFWKDFCCLLTAALFWQDFLANYLNNNFFLFFFFLLFLKKNILPVHRLLRVVWYCDLPTPIQGLCFLQRSYLHILFSLYLLKQSGKAKFSAIETEEWAV